MVDGREVAIPEHTWELESGDDIANKTQIPLNLAWALTIHKCQGQTFEQAIIELHDGTFAHGMAYVALSRVKTIEGLFTTDLNRAIRWRSPPERSDGKFFDLLSKLNILINSSPCFI